MSEDKITLADLQSSSAATPKQQLRTVDMSELPTIKKPDIKEEAKAELVSDLDKAIYERKLAMQEGFNEAREAIIENIIEEGGDPSSIRFEVPEVVVEKPASVVEAEKQSIPDEIKAQYEAERVATEQIVEASKKCDDNAALDAALNAYQEMLQKDGERKETMTTQEPTVAEQPKVEQTPVVEAPKVETTTDRVPLSQLQPVNTTANQEIMQDASKVLEDKTEEEYRSVLDLEIEEDNDILKEAEEKEAEEESQNLIKQLESDIKTLIPTKTRDLTKYKISNKPISVAKVLTKEQTNLNVTDWVLMNAQRPFSISELGGTEIERLDVRNSGRNRVQAFRAMYQTIFDHIIDPNKPRTLEEWVKSIYFYDVPHIMFGIYKATFGRTNFIPYYCPECKQSFVKEVNIMDMVKFANEEAKKKFNKLFNKDTTSNPLYETSLIPLGDFAFSLRMPSVYNIIFENASLEDVFTTKYSDILGMIAYIDNIYYFDDANQELVVIDTKTVPNDFVKTVKNKIKIYHEVMKKLPSDEFTRLIKNIGEISKIGNSTDIKYIVPAAICTNEKCGKPIAEYEKDPVDMVFSRHQLMATVNI